ncbi:hypothetical protein BDW22DRAFT_1459816 [Trametopsis cervina]|nr:hypothetical protein BDW22DRAFT_1459816 [Trametopsis cervina]
MSARGMRFGCQRSGRDVEIALRLGVDRVVVTRNGSAGVVAYTLAVDPVVIGVEDGMLSEWEEDEPWQRRTGLSVLAFGSDSSRVNIHTVQHFHFAPRVLPSNPHSLHPLLIQHSVPPMSYLRWPTMDPPYRSRGTETIFSHVFYFPHLNTTSGTILTPALVYTVSQSTYKRRDSVVAMLAVASGGGLCKMLGSNTRQVTGNLRLNLRRAFTRPDWSGGQKTRRVKGATLARFRFIKDLQEGCHYKTFGIVASVPPGFEHQARPDRWVNASVDDVYLDIPEARGMDPRFSTSGSNGKRRRCKPTWKIGHKALPMSEWDGKEYGNGDKWAQLGCADTGTSIHRIAVLSAQVCVSGWEAVQADPRLQAQSRFDDYGVNLIRPCKREADVTDVRITFAGPSWESGRMGVSKRVLYDDVVCGKCELEFLCFCSCISIRTRQFVSGSNSGSLMRSRTRYDLLPAVCRTVSVAELAVRRGCAHIIVRLTKFMRDNIIL